jgi:hypothetical protein
MLCVWLKSFISELRIINSISRPLKYTMIILSLLSRPRIIKVAIKVNISTTSI